MSRDVPDTRTAQAGGRAESSTWQRLVRLLLVIPFVALLAVPLYAREDPALLGFPFFYWYQFVMAAVTIVLMAIVYRVTRAGFGDDASEPPESRDRPR